MASSSVSPTTTGRSRLPASPTEPKVRLRGLGDPQQKWVPGEVDAQEADGVLTSDTITETDILDGRWDNAKVEGSG